MVVAKQKEIDRATLHKALDELSVESLPELASFIAYLKFKSQEQPEDWFEKVYNLFAPVREAVERSGMTEEEVNETIDAAIREVRRERKT